MKIIKLYESFLAEKTTKLIKESITMDMSFFVFKNFESTPIVITNYGGISINGETMDNYINLMDYLIFNKENLTNNLFDYKNKINKDVYDVKYIKFEIEGYKKDEKVQNFIDYLQEKFGVKSEEYSPHGMTPFYEVELSNPFVLHFNV